MGKHTKEPWVLFEVGDRHVHFCPASAKDKTSILTVTKEDGVLFAAVYNDDDARRIVACVNACEGMEDPARFIDGLKSELSLATHKLLTCGVAARHPDASLSLRESDYGGKWNSPQAESVRQLRQQRDDLLEALEALVPAACSLRCHEPDLSAFWPHIEKAKAVIAKAKGGAA